MRKRAVAKIIVCCVIGILLTGILLAGTAASLSGHLTGIPGRVVQSFLEHDSLIRKAVETTEKAFDRLPVPKLHFLGCAPVITFSDGSVKSGYSLGNASYEGKADSVSIDWAAGRIIVATHDGVEGIYLYEYAGTDDTALTTNLPKDEIAQNRQMMHRLSGGTLKIEEFPESIAWPNGETLTKTLVLLLPKTQLWSIDIDAAAANLELTGIEAGSLELDCASGKIRVSDCTISKTDIDCAAATGEFVSCTLGAIDLDSAGANFTFDLKNTPDRLELDGVAGSFRFILPSDASFAVKSDTLAGIVKINGFTVGYENGRTVVNGGAARFDLSLMSGSVIIEAAKPAEEGTSF